MSQAHLDAPKKKDGFRNRLLKKLRLHKTSSGKPQHSLPDGPPVNTNCDSERTVSPDVAAEPRPAPAEEAAREDAVPTSQPQDGSGTTLLPEGLDVWSKAFKAAVTTLGDELDKAIVQSQSIEQMFQRLDHFYKAKREDSRLQRGVECLEKYKLPLENFKRLLTLASTFAAAEPTAATVFGVLNGVTAIAIFFASADIKFKEQIDKMIQRLPWIDDCDTLGQQIDGPRIHEALVLVYIKVIEFYQIADKLLKDSNATSMFKTALIQGDRLPQIVQGFLDHAEQLHKCVESAIAVVTLEIKNMLYTSKIDQWLGADKISQQDSYHVLLRKLVSEEACRHLLEDTIFKSWYGRADRSELVLTGAMGSGKSVASAFLADELTQRGDLLVPHHLVLIYYCRDDGSAQPTHVVSALLLSLVQRLTGLQKEFFERYTRLQEAGKRPGDFKQLADIFKNLLRIAQRHVIIIIDGLDECNRSGRNSIIDFLKETAQICPLLKYLLVSRYDKEIFNKIEQRNCISLICDPKRDRMIAEHTVNLQLSHLATEVKDEIIGHLSRNADGCAVWIKMVATYIEESETHNIDPMRLLLQNLSLPRDLHELYDNLLDQQCSGHDDNLRSACTALWLLSSAWRPLTGEELGWATALAVSSESVETPDTLKRRVDGARIIRLIRAFVVESALPGQAGKSSVRLVHQSVKEYLTKRTTQPQETLGNGEDRMLHLCIEYLLMEPINQIEFFSGDQFLIDEFPLEVGLFDDRNDGAADYTVECSWDEWEKNMPRYDPAAGGFGGFFAYAASHWVDHLSTITAVDISLINKIEQLCAAGSMRLNNWTEQNRRPGCVIKPRFDFDSRLYDPLSIVSLYGSDTVLKFLLANSNFDQHYLPETGLKAVQQILLYGDLSRLEILVAGRNETFCLPFVGFWTLIIEHWSYQTCRRQHDEWAGAFSLLHPMLRPLPDRDAIVEVSRLARIFQCHPLLWELHTTSGCREILLHPTTCDNIGSDQTVAGSESVQSEASLN